MSTQTGHRLTIVEVPQAVARRSPAETSTAAKKSSTKRTRPATESKPVNKRNAGRKNLPSTKAKVKPVARRTKSSAAHQTESVRRQPMAQQPKVELTVEPVLPIEIDIPFRDMEQDEPQSDLAVEVVPAAPEPTFAELTAVEEESSVRIIENNVDADLELSGPEGIGAELEVIAESQSNVAPETIAPSETAIQSVLLAEPQSIRRTLAFKWNAFLQVLTKGWCWLQQRLRTQQAKKRLRVCESVSLGEKRFIAVVQVDGEQFLVGGSSSSVSTLAHLEQPREFSEVFRRYGQSGMQA